MGLSTKLKVCSEMFDKCLFDEFSFLRNQALFTTIDVESLEHSFFRFTCMSEKYIFIIPKQSWSLEAHRESLGSIIATDT